MKIMNEKDFKTRQEINNRTTFNLKHDIDSLRDEYEASNSDIHSMRLENHELGDLLQSKNSDIGRLKNEKDDIYDENDILESEKKELQTIVKELFLDIFMTFCL